MVRMKTRMTMKYVLTDRLSKLVSAYLVVGGETGGGKEVERQGKGADKEELEFR